MTHSILIKASLDIYLQGGKHPIEFAGLNPSSNVSCKGQVNGKLQAFNDQTTLKINHSQSIHCIRAPRKDSKTGANVYDEGTITLSTDNPAYQIYWPRDAKLPEDMASDIENSIDRLHSSIGEVKTYLNGTTWQIVGPQTVKESFAAKYQNPPAFSQAVDGIQANEGFCALTWLQGAMAGGGQVVNVVSNPPMVQAWSNGSGTGLVAQGTCLKFIKPTFTIQ